jgi:hypothetical protein
MSWPNTNFAPGAADVAVSSYSSFQGQTQTQTPPKSSVEAGELPSLDAVVDNAAVVPERVGGDQPVDNTEEDLFALPLSPRSPEMKKSPFSFL